MKFDLDVADYLEIVFCIEIMQNKLQKLKQVHQLERLKQKLKDQKLKQEKDK